MKLCFVGVLMLLYTNVVFFVGIFGASFLRFRCVLMLCIVVLHCVLRVAVRVLLRCVV